MHVLFKCVYYSYDIMRCVGWYDIGGRTERV